MTIKASICIPTYNGAKHLTECLESCVAQSYRDYEIVIADDCSSDETLAIAERFRSLDDRIRIIKNDRNLGLVGNWNNCVELARGEWIKFVFQDDYLHRDCLELMLNRGGRPIVFCRRNYLFSKDTSERLKAYYSNLPSVETLAPGSVSIGPKLAQEMILKEDENFFGEPTSVLLHKSVFHKYGLFNQDLAQLCDLEYWMRVTINEGFDYIPIELSTFRVHGESASANNRGAQRNKIINSLDRLIMLHECAYNPYYSGLRKAALKSKPRRNYRKSLPGRAEECLILARQLDEEYPGAKTGWLEIWNKRIIKRYPNIHSSVWIVLYKIYNAAKRVKSNIINLTRNSLP